MHKTYVIALREYLAAVKTKSFLIGLILMPILTIGGIVVGRLSQNVVDTTERKIAVIDHTAAPGSAATQPASRPAAGGDLFSRMLGSLMGGSFELSDRRPLHSVLIQAAQDRNEDIKNDQGEYTKPPYLIERATPADDSEAALQNLRLKLSDQVRDGELFAFIEIGKNVVPSAAAALEALTTDDLPDEVKEIAEKAQRGTLDPEDVADLQDVFENDPAMQAMIDSSGIRYSSKNTTNLDVYQWVQATLAIPVQERKLAMIGLDPATVLPRVQPLVVAQRPLAVEQADGSVGYEKAPNMLVSLFLPMILLFLLFSLLATATFPLTTNIIEEKQLRIAEVLLGSVRPFELMLGKLLGGVAVSLTLAGIYLAGGLFAARELDVISFLSVELIVWFIIFSVLATLMVGSLSVAAGAAVTNLKEAQNIQTPIVLLPMIPLFVAINVVQNPQGPLAQGFTWFPLTTPMTSVMRIAVRDGMPTYERFLAAGLSLLTTLVLVWIAGRIFRNGMLKSDKGAAFGDVVRWVTRG